MESNIAWILPGSGLASTGGAISRTPSSRVFALSRRQRRSRRHQHGGRREYHEDHADDAVHGHEGHAHLLEIGPAHDPILVEQEHTAHGHPRVVHSLSLI